VPGVCPFYIQYTAFRLLMTFFFYFLWQLPNSANDQSRKP